jgi:adenine-specific DNA-methyltransferase
MKSNPETDYTNITDLEHRQRFGQFFTHERIADFMVRWVLEGKETHIHDPAFGLGAFHRAAQEIDSTVFFTGTEVDPVALAFWQKLAFGKNVNVVQADYLYDWGNSYPAIVCNPPYMRFQKFQGRDVVFAAFEERLQKRLSGYTNTASAFLMKSVFELQENGRLAYIMPLEFLNTGYGEVVKSYLLEQGNISTIIRLDCEKDIFPDVITSAGIILFEKTTLRRTTRFYAVQDLHDLKNILTCPPINEIPHYSLNPREKWLKHFDKTGLAFNPNSLVSLSYYGSFCRGIATGANEFFVLTRSRSSSIRVHDHELLPCITKSAQIRKPVFSKDDFENMASADAPVFLLNANGRLSSGVSDYIKMGMSQGFNLRYLTKVRNPWYRVESRSPAPLLFGVFSRQGYKVIRNFSDAVNLTCYHGFQPNLFGAQLVDHLFLYLMSKVGRTILSQNMRKYGDSLDKFEPNDLNKSLVPSVELFSSIDLQRIKEEMRHVSVQGTLSPDGERIFEDLLPSCLDLKRDWK